MKKIIWATILAAPMFLTSCLDSDDDDDGTTMTYSFAVSASDYDSNGAWIDTYDTDNVGIFFGQLRLTHSADKTEYDGVTYRSWKGFTLSESKDAADHTGSDWTEFQWGNITGKGADGDNSFVLACWDVQESTEGIPTETPTCSFINYTGGFVRPLSIYITNTTYGYWAMKNGTAWSKPFGPDDWCKVTITGLAADANNNVRKTGEIEVYLAKDGTILNEWKAIDLTLLGRCQTFYFQMSSSDSGQWGMNNPAYFALDAYTAFYE